MSGRRHRDRDRDRGDRDRESGASFHYGGSESGKVGRASSFYSASLPPEKKVLVVCVYWFIRDSCLCGSWKETELQTTPLRS